jgi:hypothetical protein
MCLLLDPKYFLVLKSKDSFLRYVTVSRYSYKELGLSSCPNKGDNGVHASASPFEGLAEKSNWLKRPIEGDSFGKAMLSKGIPLSTIKAWSVDPRVELPGGGKGSLFDALEDMDSEDCLEKLEQLNKINS